MGSVPGELIPIVQLLSEGRHQAAALPASADRSVPAVPHG